MKYPHRSIKGGRPWDWELEGWELELEELEEWDKDVVNTFRPDIEVFSKVPCGVEVKPVLVIPMYVIRAFEMWVKSNGSTLEVGVSVDVEEKDGKWIIKRVHVPKQEISYGTIKILKDASLFNGFIHLHPFYMPTFSSTDDEGVLIDYKYNILLYVDELDYIINIDDYTGVRRWAPTRIISFTKASKKTKGRAEQKIKVGEVAKHVELPCGKKVVLKGRPAGVEVVRSDSDEEMAEKLFEEMTSNSEIAQWVLLSRDSKKWKKRIS